MKIIKLARGRGERDCYSPRSHQESWNVILPAKRRVYRYLSLIFLPRGSSRQFFASFYTTLYFATTTKRVAHYWRGSANKCLGIRCLFTLSSFAYMYIPRAAKKSCISAPCAAIRHAPWRENTSRFELVLGDIYAHTRLEDGQMTLASTGWQ